MIIFTDSQVEKLRWGIAAQPAVVRVFTLPINNERHTAALAAVLHSIQREVRAVVRSGIQERSLWQRN
jgi:hypothetical protein